jgi:hypothetical protein
MWNGEKINRSTADAAWSFRIWESIFTSRCLDFASENTPKGTIYFSKIAVIKKHRIQRSKNNYSGSVYVMTFKRISYDIWISVDEMAML